MANWSSGRNATVILKQGDSIEKALSIFKRKVKDYGILLEVKARTEFEKPSVMRRKQMQYAVRRNEKEKEIENF